jgi:hypothetical protein
MKKRPPAMNEAKNKTIKSMGSLRRAEIATSPRFLRLACCELVVLKA